MDYFDLEKDYGSLENAFAKTNASFLVISFTSDWLFTPGQSKAIVDALIVSRKHVSYCNIDAPFGHDSFLLEPHVLGSFLSSFLGNAHQPKAIRCSIHDSQPLDNIDQVKRTRIDYQLIEAIIEPQSTVLDVGCGDGQLLANLIVDKNIKAEGIELEQSMIQKCVEKGLPVVQQDIDLGLTNYADKSFDYIILSQTVQTVKNPKKVFTELLRVGKKVIVSFPNFAHWRCRLQLMFKGKAPISKQLPFDWYDSPNIHFMSIKDFDQFCEQIGAKVEKKIPMKKTRQSSVKLVPNFFAEQVIYITSKD
jgi:homoserine O-acetyltransferase